MTATTVYRCTFERVGRNHDVAPQDFAASNADELAQVVWHFVRRKLVSSDVEVACNLEEGVGRIFCGFRTGGTFKIEALS